ncbi:MAG: hypothetical protein LHV69_00380 [Elusimicrobia bacterium]|nr:hypothetical protein [Candidatus Obscuribacterium magneticum]MCB4755485.1 hypothetical protein [Candidatus Obscuribacterium magneticum]
MSKKDKKKSRFPSDAVDSSTETSPRIISRRGWKIIGSGIFTVIVGFFVLSFTDPRGQNMASTLSPILIILGYTIIGFGILARDPSEHPNN